MQLPPSTYGAQSTDPAPLEVPADSHVVEVAPPPALPPNEEVVSPQEGDGTVAIHALDQSNPGTDDPALHQVADSLHSVSENGQVGGYRLPQQADATVGFVPQPAEAVAVPLGHQFPPQQTPEGAPAIVGDSVSTVAAMSSPASHEGTGDVHSGVTDSEGASAQGERYTVVPEQETSIDVPPFVQTAPDQAASAAVKSEAILEGVQSGNPVSTPPEEEMISVQPKHVSPLTPTDLYEAHDDSRLAVQIEHHIFPEG